MLSLTLSVELLLMTSVGIFTQKMRIVNEDFDTQLTKFLLNIILPCLIFNSIIAEPYSPEVLKNCLAGLILGAVVTLLQLALGHVVYLMSGKSSKGRVMRHGMTFVHLGGFTLWKRSLAA